MEGFKRTSSIQSESNKSLLVEFHGMWCLWWKEPTGFILITAWIKVLLLSGSLTFASKVKGVRTAPVAWIMKYSLAVSFSAEAKQVKGQKVHVFEVSFSFLFSPWLSPIVLYLLTHAWGIRVEYVHTFFKLQPLSVWLSSFFFFIIYSRAFFLFFLFFFFLNVWNWEGRVLVKSGGWGK